LNAKPGVVPSANGPLRVLVVDDESYITDLVGTAFRIRTGPT
jgi:hypothetical protein